MRLPEGKVCDRAFIAGAVLVLTSLSSGMPNLAWGQRLVPVVEGVYVFRNIVNSGVVVTERGVVVIDTHCHGDHTYGNSVFAPETPIIAHERTPALMTAREHRMKEFYESGGIPARSFPVVLPTLTFADRLTLMLGTEVIELRHLGKMETDDAIVVYLPRKGVLFGGDGVRNDDFPMLGMPNMAEGLTLDGEWVQVLEQIERLAPE